MCYTPFVKRETMEVFPCGRCPVCLKRRVAGWAFRFNQELKRSFSAQVITLTYDWSGIDEENVSSEGVLQLSKRHVQLFFKKLRRSSDPVELKKFPIKYYAVGEYGSINQRPHYHILLFNARIELIQDAWSRGNVYYDVQMSDQAIYYCLKYMMKWSNSKYAREFNIVDREPEFSLMSKRLGANYITKAMVKWHKADLENRMYLNLLDGKKIAMPRYYKEKIYEEEEREAIAFVSQVKYKENNKIYQELMIEAFGDKWENVHSEMVRSEFTKMYNNAKKGRTL